MAGGDYAFGNQHQVILGNKTATKIDREVKDQGKLLASASVEDNLFPGSVQYM